LNSGAQIDALDNEDETPLYAVARQAFWESSWNKKKAPELTDKFKNIFRLYVAKGANLHLASKDGGTILNMANFLLGSQETTKILKELQAK